MTKAKEKEKAERLERLQAGKRRELLRAKWDFRLSDEELAEIAAIEDEGVQSFEPDLSQPVDLPAPAEEVEDDLFDDEVTAVSEQGWDAWRPAHLPSPDARSVNADEPHVDKMKKRWGAGRFRLNTLVVRRGMSAGLDDIGIATRFGFTLGEVRVLKRELVEEERKTSGLLGMGTDEAFLQYAARLEGIASELDMMAADPQASARERITAIVAKRDTYQQIHKAGIESGIFKRAPQKRTSAHLHVHATIDQIHAAFKDELAKTENLRQTYGTTGYNGLDVVNGLPQLGELKSGEKIQTRKKAKGLRRQKVAASSQ